MYRIYNAWYIVVRKKKCTKITSDTSVRKPGEEQSGVLRTRKGEGTRWRILFIST